MDTTGDTNEFKQATFTVMTAATKERLRKGSVSGVDLNEASFEELQTLPGIGPKLAERIMANRPYHKVDDLLKVQGIGPTNSSGFGNWCAWKVLNPRNEGAGRTRVDERKHGITTP